MKWVLHWWTGKSEVERVLLAESWKSHRMSYAVTRSIWKTSMMGNVRTIIFQDDFDTVCVATMVADYKCFDRRDVALKRLPECLVDIKNCNKQIRYLDQLRIEPFDIHFHGPMLNRVWTGLKGKTVLTDWTEIGFQGNKPENDFRGMGVLALRCLVHMVKTRGRESRDIYHHYPELPFCITAINVVGFTFQALEQRHFDILFYTNEDKALEMFAAKFCDFFEKFIFYWTQGSRHIFDFQQMFRDFQKRTISTLRKTVY